MTTPWMRKIHRWIGLLIGLQLVLWMASGLVMSVLDSETVRGRDSRAPRKSAPAWPEDALPADRVLAQAVGPVHSLSAAWLLDQPVYKLAVEKGVRMVDARQGHAVELSAEMAQRLAAASYQGSGRPGQAELLEPTLETRSHPGRVWRVPFSDAEDTTVYLSPQGDLLEHRNRTWRLFDVFWMLHIMDYSGRKDFNNALVVGSAVGGLWLALSGVWLLFASFRLAEFIPQRWRARRSVAVYGSDGSRLRAVTASAGDTVFVALRRQGLQLPSNCGGGQSCGLCAVQVKGAAPAATAADRTLLTPAKVQAGYRLACNLAVKADLEVEVAGGAELWDTHRAVIEAVRTPSPFLREFILKPDFIPGPTFHPGSFIQVHVPPYQMERDRLQVPAEHRADWQALHLRRSWQNKTELRRSYSLSSPVDPADGRLTLLVRLIHPGPGVGSSYMYSLKAGDTLDFSGPFGDFAIQPGQREKIFIGGGAGMGPLRAMIRSLLQAGAGETVHFWYGARTRREAPFVDEMNELAARHANFRWHLVLSHPAKSSVDDAAFAHGWVHEAATHALLRSHPNLAACDFYVCGPPAMLAATRAVLASLGVKPERVAFDDFKV